MKSLSKLVATGLLAIAFLGLATKTTQAEENDWGYDHQFDNWERPYKLPNWYDASDDQYETLPSGQINEDGYDHKYDTWERPYKLPTWYLNGRFGIE
ncbi:hypothetical protein HMPREF9318_00305 [Streptococcus urinalis FB127-CNA-2]|uniref:Uncharacterized protein n=1 Tax=Streptococcus urinalis 2285-97 TaxID=764291 RepID=G5KFP5_9STRE|nr:hypothetical protein [Streptococcus urinalis]EHJ56744.1 hypothetical protein STRUR_1052 [Streptococcus urinalis 2285-97]EKS22107.1 hypothetical protein HMPREF9318_00305 [Streptococcus urinalis FB127-CNA-2]VEF31919.1 Uncharacterised protein [Streptococcus urinalis]